MLLNLLPHPNSWYSAMATYADVGSIPLQAFYSAQNGSESKFRDRCFLFFVWSCATYYGLFCAIVMRYCWSLIALLEVYCAIVSRYYLSFKWSGKVVFFNLFCHFSFYFFAPAAFILELHRCSKGRSISRVQTENCTIDKQSPHVKFFLFSKQVLLLIVSELSSGLLPLPFKVRITIDKQSLNGKLYDR